MSLYDLDITGVVERDRHATGLVQTQVIRECQVRAASLVTVNGVKRCLQQASGTPEATWGGYLECWAQGRLKSIPAGYPFALLSSGIRV